MVGYVDPTFGIDLARLLLAWDAPITMTADDDMWRFEQVLPPVEGGHTSRALDLQNPAWANQGAVDDLPRGDVVQRVSLDRASFLPRRWEWMHRSQDGDIVLDSLTVRDWRRLDAALPDDIWVLPSHQ